MSLPARYKLIACEILYREICFCLSQCKTIVDVTFMEKGLHDMGEAKMAGRLQEEVDKIDTAKYDAILLAYGLCNNGIRGLHAARLPLVVPRAHDCITLLLGSKEKYAEYFKNNPGTYFKSTGWIERDTGCDTNSQSITSQLGMHRTYQEYVDRYGEENATYLMETLGDWTKNYTKMAYLDTGIGDFPEYRDQTRELAREKGWAFEELRGNTNLLLRLVNGEWPNESFLVVPPCKSIIPAYDEGIIGLSA
ncbi:MAG: hypothetical protein A2487_18175 [Candidatus Raymondbacteria bacterium RifOxyC12_full_50_8]|uniref:DUF1638 domain-containing protein n=1 Tax=Candidatus Raymondbacteria bacterium RIFOXYD12_FULL_49_13 TaxID=1817890 RepID=A0A1F7F594_UNCRA|nr:MAG: hypothetical protein A2350_19380 [Candidatus Raymondbacteria bacterium RifOxyB12_full_50_8]OGJ87187.1 MAG: hypothetical protein A2248_04105 [Candidatus Raymondbacteria bacterium RIFOXYA2_FULL_49_16]OGJ95332.1 MAG: hypothetical protein A2487_18175 [Candidatus Raymondbacteria bacterium RifOxyC12_full_50_8]OGK01811.1 MAG: hypothetical protein A2519_03020 [Candidatus Raymondbacteria bacterium RIFOXYD12_FULL_49_13]OGP41183.1 MAG: hypothetical protein A2324_08750 [Candidatus Raymondbacteria b